MILMKSVPDDTMAVAGFEHHTFMCSGCNDVERRLIFRKCNNPGDGDVVSVHAAPPISPAASQQSERVAAPGILRRMLARLRGGVDAAR
jgi:hypothetical protein